MNLFKVIKTSYMKSLKGEEKLWKVIWLWGFLLYVGSIAIGFGMMSYHNLAENILGYDPISLRNRTIISDLVLIPLGILGVCGIILLIVYPFVFIFSLFRCSEKVGIPKRIYAMIYAVIFIIFGGFLMLGSYAIFSYYVNDRLMLGICLFLDFLVFLLFILLSQQAAKKGVRKNFHAMITAIFFITFHGSLGVTLIGFGAAFNIFLSISGALIAIALAIFTIVKTKKLLTKKP